MAVRVLLVLAVLVSFYGCGQSNPVPEQIEKKDPEQLPVREKTEASPKPETTAAAEPTDMLSLQTGASSDPSETGSVVAGTSGEERKEQAEGSCRLVNYVAEEGMNQQEGAAFSERVANEMMEDMGADPSMTVGPAQNAALDRLNVPRYSKCKQ